MEKNPVELIMKLQNGEQVWCSQCEAPFKLIGPKVLPEYAECSHGHRVYYVLTTEMPPNRSEKEQ
jgi:hypothetical protein